MTLPRIPKPTHPTHLSKNTNINKHTDAARALNQGTKFGAMLDQLTDRCATMTLLATLCTFYPSWTFFFQLSMVIDISCHWIHLHTSLMQVRTRRDARLGTWTTH